MKSESENGKTARLARLFGPPPAGVTLGIGDDAAVLAPPPGRSLVWTVDAQVDQVHFRRAWLTLADIGWRSFVAAASDIAAMGAEPWCALSALVLPPDVDDDALDAIASGQAEAAAAVGAPIVGGNLARGGEMSITTTLLGSAARAIPRSGARPGDGIWLVGELGLASAGLRSLLTGARGSLFDAAVRAFRRPSVRIASGLRLAAHAHAAVDVSDGLEIDAARMATGSQVAIVLEARALMEHSGEALAAVARHLGVPVLDLVLGGGEDYAIVAASPEPIVGYTRVGEVRPGSGLWLRDGDGERLLGGDGFDHFAR